MKLKPEIKTQWLSALRSGQYAQGVGALRIKGAEGTPDRFCCLGVLCDLAEQVGIGGVTHHFDDDDEHAYYEDSSCYLPDSVMRWAIEGPDKPSESDFPFGVTGSDSNSLVHMNDTGSSFDEIANAIEEHF